MTPPSLRCQWNPVSNRPAMLRPRRYDCRRLAMVTVRDRDGDEYEVCLRCARLPGFTLVGRAAVLA